MNIWASALSAGIVSGLIAYLLSIRGDGRSTFRADRGTVEVGVPRRRVAALRVIAACTPLLTAIVMVAAPGKKEFSAGVALVALMLGGAGGLLLIAAVMARRFVFSAEGIRVVGFRGWQSRWSELESIEATSPGADIAVFRFRGGRKVAVDSSFEGWSDLMKQVPMLVGQEEDVREKITAAIRELNRWKVGAERY